MFRKVKVGDIVIDRNKRKRVLEVVELSNGWQIVKTENDKSPRDFKVKLINSEHPRGLTIKHAHIAIDFYGKLCQDKEKALKVFEAIIKVWQGVAVKEVIDEYEPYTRDLVGYTLEYILCSLKWILEQEDVNFIERPPERQIAIDEKLEQWKIKTPEGRLGSQLAIALLCEIASGIHPVEAFHRANLNI
ncbi:MAG: hypothetical protein QW190_05915 [Thermoproteota archaeon]